MKTATMKWVVHNMKWVVHIMSRAHHESICAHHEWSRAISWMSRAHHENESCTLWRSRARHEMSRAHHEWSQTRNESAHHGRVVHIMKWVVHHENESWTSWNESHHGSARTQPERNISSSPAPPAPTHPFQSSSPRRHETSRKYHVCPWTLWVLWGRGYIMIARRGTSRNIAEFCRAQEELREQPKNESQQTLGCREADAHTAKWAHHRVVNTWNESHIMKWNEHTAKWRIITNESCNTQGNESCNMKWMRTSCRMQYHEMSRAIPRNCHHEWNAHHEMKVAIIWWNESAIRNESRTSWVESCTSWNESCNNMNELCTSWNVNKEMKCAHEMSRAHHEMSRAHHGMSRAHHGIRVMNGVVSWNDAHHEMSRAISNGVAHHEMSRAHHEMIRAHIMNVESRAHHEMSRTYRRCRVVHTSWMESCSSWKWVVHIMNGVVHIIKCQHHESSRAHHEMSRAISCRVVHIMKWVVQYHEMSRTSWNESCMKRRTKTHKTSPYQTLVTVGACTG
jgi:hypothetical protein